MIFRFTYFDEIYQKKVPTESTTPDLGLSTKKMDVTLDTYSHVLPGLQKAAALRFEEGLQQLKVK